MDSSEDFYFSDALLWSLVKKFVNDSNEPDDLMSEARAAAYYAVTKYKKTKKTKLSTFVFKCVKNRLLDITKKKRVTLEPYEEEGSYDTEDDLHFAISMRQLLNPTEYRVYQLSINESRKEQEVMEILNLTRRKVRACLCRIFAKYQSIETSHHRVSTQRRLTSKWLVNSTP